jgi:group I intron endonuclease
MYKLDNYSELPPIQGIYFIINTINQKYYLGRAVNINDRYSWKDLEYSHHNNHLKNSIIKYGRENFIISVVEYPNITLQELINIEQELLDIHFGLPLCYNKSKSASGGKVCEINPNFGKKCYNDGTQNILVSPGEEIPEGYIIGRLPMSEDSKQKRKGENNPNFGKKWYNNGIENRIFSPSGEIPEGYTSGRLPFSDEIKQIMSDAQKNKPNQEAIKYNHKIKTGTKVITLNCCYYSIPDACKDLNLSSGRFYKLFELDTNTGFFKYSNKPIINIKKRYINNSIKNRKIPINEEIPEGWIKGKLPMSNTQKKKISNSRKKYSEVIKFQNKITRGTRVITSSCCYYSRNDALIELNVPLSEFKKLFVKDPQTGFFMEPCYVLHTL